MGNVKDVDQDNFEKVMNGSKGKLVVVEFYTQTCPNCKVMIPIYEQVAGEMSGKAIFTRVDSNRNMQLALRFGIMGVPAFKFFCHGKEVGGIVGTTNVTALANTVKDLIRHGAGCKSTALIYEIDGYA
ncbi:MAG: thioredoxin family protein [Candidatus Thermoplasmatota archaeon]|nr:thioredoxin family protein [Candidatus Thermoplasmatota archaeon]MBU4143803.1 thioredoxin family protein [Candidatus Thermoplasmatota archaeon]MBU4592461.1 thioredoxin family protein [Candidatus Thermoplasmatota archaeon]